MTRREIALQLSRKDFDHVRDSAFATSGNLIAMGNGSGPAGLVFAAGVNSDGISDIGVLAADTMSIYLGQGSAVRTRPASVLDLR